MAHVSVSEVQIEIEVGLGPLKLRVEFVAPVKLARGV